jgi:catechol 2,3-dioxygenase-like lactoylglutathione lyase family enzyme
MKPRGILETALYCDDLDAAERFYSTVLGLECIGRHEDRHVFFRCGAGVLLLFDPAHTSTVQTSVDGVPIPLHGTRGPGHMAFSASLGEMDHWRERLIRHGVAIEADVQWGSGGRSLYFRDPCGNSIEIATPELWPL